MRLSDFIRTNSKPIIDEWENFARTLIANDSDKGSLTLRDHIEQILAFIAQDIDSPQTDSEQARKSRGEDSNNFSEREEYSAAETHADLRVAGGFNMDQMVSEYRALRASVIKLWSAQPREMSNVDVLDLIRFNESIDQALTESISHYTKKTRSFQRFVFSNLKSRSP